MSKKIYSPEEIVIPHGHNTLCASVSMAKNPLSWAIFAHGSGSSHCSPRNRRVAQYLNEQGICTLLFELVTAEEDVYYRNRFHVPMMAERLLHTILYQILRSKLRIF